MGKRRCFSTNIGCPHVNPAQPGADCAPSCGLLPLGGVPKGGAVGLILAGFLGVFGNFFAGFWRFFFRYVFLDLDWMFKVSFFRERVGDFECIKDFEHCFGKNVLPFDPCRDRKHK
jgi:hypothetical protein